MTLPDGVLSTIPQPAPVLPPDERTRTDLTVDYELGGIGISDPSQGLEVQVWRAYVDEDGVSIYVVPELGGTPFLVTTAAATVTEISLTFDQNMNASVAYIAGGDPFLYWYDTVPEEFVTTPYPGITTPFLTLDDKRPSQLGTSDMLLFYLKAGKLYFRQQRDRFSIEYELTEVPSYIDRILAVGMGRNLRMQIYIAATAQANEAYTDLTTDTLYIASPVGIVPMFDENAEPWTGIWRSKVIVLDFQPSFSWGIVEGDYPVTVRLYGDGALFYTTPTITSRAPFRLPPGRFREWEIEVESASRVTGVYVANSLHELESA